MNESSGIVRKNVIHIRWYIYYNDGYDVMAVCKKQLIGIHFFNGRWEKNEVKVNTAVKT